MTDVIAGRFALCDPIARGGSGVVWRAYDRKLGRFCAAKVLRRRDAGDLLRFVREQSVRIAHPHVLTPYSWAAEDSHVVIASELADGGSLSTLIGDYGPLAEPTVAAILDQVLEALEHVHAAGLVHRDVKPANVLLRATGLAPLHVMLGDFGLAMGASDAHLTQIGTVVGTPGYLAPELMRGGVRPDPRQDLFAVGRVAAALLTGVEPSDHSPSVPAARPGPLRDVVTALSSLDVTARPPSATHARAALRGLVGDARPHTLGGEAVDVLHQLPPLSDEALAEAGARPTRVLAAGPVATAKVRAKPTRRTRRGRLLAGAGVAAAIAVAVPVSLTLADSPTGSGTPSDTTTVKQPAGRTGSSGSTPSSTVDQTVTVEVGANCTWQQQGDEQSTSRGTKVICARTSDGYIWSKG